MTIPLRLGNQKKIRLCGSRKIEASTPGTFVSSTAKNLFDTAKLPTKITKMKSNAGGLKIKLTEIVSLRTKAKAMQIAIVGEHRTRSLAI